MKGSPRFLLRGLLQKRLDLSFEHRFQGSDGKRAVELGEILRFHAARLDSFRQLPDLFLDQKFQVAGFIAGRRLQSGRGLQGVGDVVIGHQIGEIADILIAKKVEAELGEGGIAPDGGLGP